ncbi:UDP-N-acetylglucosamine transferase subunit ALG13 [Meyerozyma sp. JA9]|nr:UDP-N-acetylglucosamine transferase subunit ALG13 [Meyerozyma sp. JA9]
MATVLVTTGATVTFKELISYLCSGECISKLAGLGIKKLIVQYGNEIGKSGDNTSRGHFEKSAASLETSGFKRVAEATDDNIVLESESIKIEAFPFTHDILSYIKKADIIVSHAGTGSIIDVLRLKKKLVVVTNDSLLDNHQLEVASMMAKEGYLINCTLEEMRGGKLVESIGDMISGKASFNALPDPEGGAVETVIVEEIMG